MSLPLEPPGPTDPASMGMPRYAQIATHLREQIRTNGLAPHTLLPSERELSESHGVSRMTARQALTLLENEGLVYRRPPRGTFVAETRVLFRLGSFSAEVLRVGRRPGARLLSSVTTISEPAVRAALGVPSRGRVHELQRLRTADEEPLAIETTYLPEHLAPDLLDHPLEGSLWALLRDAYGVVPATATARVQFVVLDELAGARLRMRAGAPGIMLTRLTYDSAGRCIEYARDVYRADRTAFEFDATVHPPDRLEPPR